jgi:adenylate cyclase
MLRCTLACLQNWAREETRSLVISLIKRVSTSDKNVESNSVLLISSCGGVFLASLEHGRVPSPRSIASKEVPLVDRVEEMNALKEAVYRAVHGEGGLVFIHGEAGIGKTRLVRELGAYARSRGVQVLYGRCPALFRMDGVPPYILWKEVIKDYLETCTPEQLYRVIGFYPAEVAKLVPEISQKLRTIPQSFPISPDQEQNRLFEAVSQFITNISQETPLLVVLDDLQWTDPSSLLLLHYLARGVQKRPLLLLGAYRSTDIDTKHPLTPVLMELNRERLPQSVSLKRMSLEDISEMIKQMLEQDDVPAEFCKMIYEKTRGNPFFAEEVIKSLKEEEVIYREENRWKLKEVTKIEFPETVKSLIKARIDRLDDEHQNVLTMASLVGNDFTFEALKGVIGLEEDKLRKIVDELLKTGLLKHRVVHGEDVCSFADIIVRDVVYEEVGTFERKKLHRVVGTALEKAYAQKADEHIGELALHFLEGGDKDKALDYFLKAGEKAQKVYAHNEAFSYLEHALKLLEEKEASIEKKAGVIEKLGDFKAWIGETDACLEYWNKSLALWNQLGNKRKIAELHIKMANILWDAVGDKEKASEHHSAALQILEKEPESVELARLYENISHMLWRTGEIAKASHFAHKALELAKRFGDAEILAECYNDLAGVTESMEESAEHLEEGLKIAVENNCMETALRLYNNISIYYETIGKTQKAVETRQKGFELGKKVGETASTSWIGRTLAYSYLNMGDVQKALVLLEELLARGKRTKNTVGIAQATNYIGRIYQYLGEWGQSLQYLREGYRIAIDTDDYQTIAEAAAMLGELFMETEDYSEAEKYLNEGNSIYEKAGNTMYQVYFTLPPLARLYLKRGEIEKAKELIERMYEYASKERFRAVILIAEMLKGMLFKEQRNWEQSIQHFEKSLAECKSLNAEKWYVYLYAGLLYEYGSMYLEKNKGDDKEKARNLFNQALEIFQKMGAKKDIEKVEARIAFIETGKVVSKPKPIDHVSTGYADLDKLLHGGIPPNYAVVLTSPSCDERDILVKSFLETGAKKGEVTFYVTIDAGLAKNLAEEFQSNFYLFVCNPQADIIVRDSPSIFKLKGVENLTDISIALTSAIRKLDPMLKGPRRICMGLVSDVLLQHHAVQTRRWLTALITELKSMRFTILVTIDPRMHPSEELYAILGLFDGEINIYEKETEKGSKRFLKVKKISNQEYLENELLLKKEDIQKRK